jgi:hypothetical protein
MGEVKAGVFASDENWRATEGMPAWLWVQAHMVGGGAVGPGRLLALRIVECEGRKHSTVTERAWRKVL